MQEYDLIIIGTGHAGVQLGALLRQYGYAGSLLLISEDHQMPYQRPPLSKAWLKSEISDDDLALKQDRFYADHQIDLVLDTKVLRIDRAHKRIITSDHTIGFDKLVIATGTRLRRLDPSSFADSEPRKHIHCLYDFNSAQTLKQALTDGGAFNLIGGGYIGLELAATARLMDHEVRVFERDQRLLARTGSNDLSQKLQKKHESMGVMFHLGAQNILIHNDHIKLDQNHHFAHQHIILGIGAIANDGLARECGIECDNGIMVNEFGQTNDACIYAIGDVSQRPHSLLGRRLRLESVPSALEMAKSLACHLTNRPIAAPEVPWFWSDQYDWKLQIAGILTPSITKMIYRESTDGFSFLHLDDDNKLVAAECVNKAADFMAAKQLIHRKIALKLDGLDDPQQSLKSFLL